MGDRFDSNDVERVGPDHQAAARLLRQRGDGFFHFVVAGDGHGDEFRGAGLMRGFDLANPAGIERRRAWIEQQPGPGHAGHDLLQKPYPFADQGRVDERKAGKVAARTRQTLDMAKADRIGRQCKHDRDRIRHALQHRNDRRAVGQDHIGRQRHQFFGILPDQFALARRPPVFDVDIFAFLPAEIRKAPTECRDAHLAVRVALHTRQQYADLAQRGGRLGARRERQAGRAGDQTDELPPLHQEQLPPIARTTGLSQTGCQQ